MKIAVYIPTYNRKHCDILRSFAAGIPGATVKLAKNFIPGEADIGVVFGWYKYSYEKTMSKRPIIEHYLAKGSGHLIIVESAFQCRGHYYQIGWDGFAGSADFKNEGARSDRWGMLDISPKPWRQSDGGNCVVIGQLPRDTQVQDVGHTAWCRWAVNMCLETYGNVLFRPHPKCDDPGIYGISEEMFDTDALADSLAKDRCVVTWNSTTGVDAVIAGVPVVAMDEGSISWPMASHKINDPLVRPNRDKWFAKLGYSQWTLDEMRKGLPWRHLTR